MKSVYYLHPDLQRKLKELQSVCENNNIKLEITDTLRTKRDQNILYEQGRMNDNEIVTDRMYPNDYHCWGLAIDIKVSPDNTENYNIICNKCKSMGLTINGNNIEYPIMSLKELRYKYTDLHAFMSTWKNYKIIDIIDNSIIDKAYNNSSMIETLQMALNSDNITSSGRKLSLTGIMDKPTLEAIDKLSKFKFVESRYYSVVKFCQKILKLHNFNISITGNYNKETRKAIVDMKNNCDIRANDIIDRSLIILLIGTL